jgi:hypothetical protein
MKYSAVRNCKWATEDHSSIECEVMFDDITSEEWSPFGANPNDHYEHGREIFAKAVSGEFGEIAEYIPPPPPPIAPKKLVDPTIDVTPTEVTIEPTV